MPKVADETVWSLESEQWRMTEAISIHCAIRFAQQFACVLSSTPDPRLQTPLRRQPLVSLELGVGQVIKLKSAIGFAQIIMRHRMIRLQLQGLLQLLHGAPRRRIIKGALGLNLQRR